MPSGKRGKKRVKKLRSSSEDGSSGSFPVKKERKNEADQDGGGLFRVKKEPSSDNDEDGSGSLGVKKERSSENDGHGGGLFRVKKEPSSEDDEDGSGSFGVKKLRSSSEDTGDGSSGSVRVKKEPSSEDDEDVSGSSQAKKEPSSEDDGDGSVSLGVKKIPGSSSEDVEDLESFSFPPNMPHRTYFTLQEMQRLKSMMDNVNLVQPSDGPTKMLFGSLFWAAYMNMTNKHNFFVILDVIDTGIDQVQVSDSPLSPAPSKMPLLIGWKFLIKCQKESMFNFQREIGRIGNPRVRVVKRFQLGFLKMKLKKMRAIVQMVKSPVIKDQKELAKLFSYLVDMRTIIK